MGPLTYPALRQLARMHRAGIDGAGDELLHIARTRGPELADALRFPRANLERLAEAEDPVALIVATIEGAPRLRREAIQRSRRESASGLAKTLCSISERRDDDEIELHGPLLSELLLLWGAGWVVFGERGSVNAPQLRAILRECRGLRSTAVVLGARELFVVYETERSRGIIRLHLQRVVYDADALHIPTELVPVQPIDTAEPPIPLGEQPQMPAAHAARPRRGGFLRALVEVAVAAALGGGP